MKHNQLLLLLAFLLLPMHMHSMLNSAASTMMRCAAMRSALLPSVNRLPLAVQTPSQPPLVKMHRFQPTRFTTTNGSDLQKQNLLQQIEDLETKRNRSKTIAERSTILAITSGYLFYLPVGIAAIACGALASPAISYTIFSGDTEILATLFAVPALMGIGFMPSGLFSLAATMSAVHHSKKSDILYKELRHLQHQSNQTNRNQKHENCFFEQLQDDPDLWNTTRGNAAAALITVICAGSSYGIYKATLSD